MNWVYEDKEVEYLPENTYGFIYQIDYDDDTSYIGKKNCYTETQLPALKSGVVRPEALYRVGRNIKGKRVQFDVVRKETKWKSYKGSSELSKGKTILRKTILMFCSSKRELTYMECKALFCLDAIEDEKYLNINILGRFYRSNLS
jgi:hypothetical protein